LRTGSLRALAQRLETTFVGRCARSFIGLQGIDRALVLASQALTALIPILLLVSALAPAGDRDVISAAFIGRFRLTGGAADAMRQLFAHSGSSAVGLLSGFLLHGFDGSCRGPKACRHPPGRNLVETRTANNNLALAA
jgi:hypothetical protein